MPSPAPTEPGLVRPRYVDEDSGESLPLLDLVVERVLGPAPGRLVVTGPRGSGVSTAITWLRAQVEALGWTPIGPDALPSEAGASAPTGLVVLLDLSVAPHPERDVQRALAFLRRPEARGLRVVVGVPAPVDEPAEGTGPAKRPPHVRLAPWTWDDVVELLAASRFRTDRPRILTTLRALPDAHALIARPRAAVWLADAALPLGPEEPATLGRLYANVLDTLAPSTLEVLRRLRDGVRSTTQLLDVLAEVPDLDPTELGPLFELPLDLVRGSACVSATRRRRAWRAAGCLAERARLVLPGLQHLLQAGECLAAVARGEPPDVVPQAWDPFLRELITPTLRATLRAWLAGSTAHGDAQAATILWATGERPPLDASLRPLGLDLAGARLPGLAAPGTNLAASRLTSADLGSARLEGATLRDVVAADARLDEVHLDGADLTRVDLARSSLRRASLVGAQGDRAMFVECDLREACLDRARLDAARLAACDLTRASLRGASLRGVRLERSTLAAANLEGLDLEDASLLLLRLHLAATFAPASLCRAVLEGCSLIGVDLADVEAESVCLRGCALQGASFAGARLYGARFEGCVARDVRFDGADLPGASFLRVGFGGSTRSGLLVGAPPLEGSRTGFYAEGTTDDPWRESCRASFRGAELRGACFEGTSLARVDLRGAALDSRLRAQARAEGAILD
jgi:uncharacterized protein YjbI with pentapeptide repeats